MPAEGSRGVPNGPARHLTASAGRVMAPLLSSRPGALGCIERLGDINHDANQRQDALVYPRTAWQVAACGTWRGAPRHNDSDAPVTRTVEEKSEAWRPPLGRPGRSLT